MFLLASNRKNETKCRRKRNRFLKMLKTMRMRQKTRYFVERDRNRREMAKNETSINKHIFEEKEKWTQEGKTRRYTKGKIEKKTNKKRPNKDMKDKMKKNGQKKKKMNGEEKTTEQRRKNKRLETKKRSQKKWSKSDKTTTTKNRKEHRKIINYCRQEEVKTNEISDKRDEWQNETKKKWEKKKWDQ